MSYDIKHVIWDWNGTLLNDAEITIQASIRWLETLGVSGVTKAQILEHCVRDFAQFYKPFLGRLPTDDEIADARDCYWAIYEPAKRDLPLADDAIQALGDVVTNGRGQSVLSMAPHAELVELIDRHGLTGHFQRVDGDKDGSAHSKLENLRQHLGDLAIDPAQAAMIGDALDDYEVSAALGVQPILVETGMYSRKRLEKTGAPVARNLVEAIRHLR